MTFALLFTSLLASAATPSAPTALTAEALAQDAAIVGPNAVKGQAFAVPTLTEICHFIPTLDGTELDVWLLSSRQAPQHEHFANVTQFEGVTFPEVEKGKRDVIAAYRTGGKRAFMVLSRTESGRFERATSVEMRFANNVSTELTLPQVRSAYLAFLKTLEQTPVETGQVVQLEPHAAETCIEAHSVTILRATIGGTSTEVVADERRVLRIEQVEDGHITQASARITNATVLTNERSQPLPLHQTSWSISCSEAGCRSALLGPDQGRSPTSEQLRATEESFHSLWSEPVRGAIDGHALQLTSMPRLAEALQQELTTSQTAVTATKVTGMTRRPDAVLLKYQTTLGWNLNGMKISTPVKGERAVSLSTGQTLSEDVGGPFSVKRGSKLIVGQWASMSSERVVDRARCDEAVPGVAQ